MQFAKRGALVLPDVVLPYVEECCAKRNAVMRGGGGSTRRSDAMSGRVVVPDEVLPCVRG